MGASTSPTRHPGRTPAQRSDIVLAEMERILACPSFRNAKRSQDFLRYVVTNTLDGQSDALKERLIGAAVFQKPIDYAPAEDSVVRVMATDLRKRLAQFYLETGLDHPVTILLPAGSYAPEFRWGAEPVAVVEAGERSAPPASGFVRARRRYLLWSALVVCAAALAVYQFTPLRGVVSPSALDRFWQPVIDSHHPVLLSVASPIVFRLPSVELSDKSQLAAMPPSVCDSKLLPSTGYVGRGDALALAELCSFFRARSKAIQIRMGKDTAFTDLRNSPVVLIGGFSNPWTMKMTSDLRYVFQTAGERNSIQDRTNPSRRWDESSASPGGGVDYALISRLFDSRTGDVLICAAGLGHGGTQVAGEFLTSAHYMDAAFHSAPRDWKRRNVQVLLKTELVGGNPGPAKIIDTWVW